MFERALNHELLRQAAEAICPGQTLRATGVWGSSSALIAAALGRLSRRPVLFIARHLDEADEIADDIELFTGTPARLLPAWEVDIAGQDVNDEVTGERLGLLNALARPREQRPEPVEFLVAPVMALLQPVPTRDTLRQAGLTVGRGTAISIEFLTAWLVDAGFEPVEQVDQQGEFARRGGIVDVFPGGSAQAVRIEFFGDEVDSVRLFDLDTQRSTDEIAAYDITSIAAGRVTAVGQTTHFLEYLDPDTLVCLHEPGEVAELAQQLYGRMQEASGHRAAEGLNRPETLFAAVGALANVEMYTFAGKRGPQALNLGVRSLERLTIDTHEALTELTELSAVADVWVYCENPAEQQRFGEMLREHHPELAPKVKLAIGHLAGGFYWPAGRLAAVGHHELFHRYAKVRRIRRVRAGRPIESLLDLTDGDYVVHVGHGIARFEGLRQLEKDGRSEEYLSLRFADNATLHVPASKINLVQKYIGSHQHRPALSTLGGTLWSKAKNRVAEAVRDMAADMLAIQAMRESTPGLSYPRATDWQRQFAQEFLYTETEDQLAAIGQIDEDMLTPRPMDRLLCGDVGFGKTEVAMRAAFKTVEAGKQVAVLAPTTVLADQHGRTFKERFADFPFGIDVLSRFRSTREIQDILKRLALGQVDILIGTHRILSQDVKFPDLGLLIVDEEQRFGVEHKEKLKKVRATVEVLTMTATPIPRTLHMSLLGLRDISSLATPPMDRRAIHTEVCRWDDDMIRAAVLRELNRQGQVYVVHNRVDDIRLLADRVQTLVPEARIGVVHGQMPRQPLEKTMLRFLRNDLDVLVATTIIESGLDIPTANTIIIHNADRYGLAELHQLRGRVGRWKHRAFCYLVLPEDRPVTPVAAKRLKAIEEFSDLGAGFQIAMRDLEIRGAGNILGPEQSGHIAAVGYELYCQLLENSVRELRGEAPRGRPEVHVDLGLDVYIPRWYVPSDRQRMEIYRRLAQCHAAEEIAQLTADLDDAYGKAPTVVQTLLDLTEIRVLAGRLGIAGIVRMDPDLVFSVRNMAEAQKVFEGAAGTARLPDNQTVHWRLPKAYREMPTLVTVLLKRLRQAAGKV